MENSYEKDLSRIDTHTHLHVKRFDRERENILRWMQENVEYKVSWSIRCQVSLN